MSRTCSISHVRTIRYPETTSSSRADVQRKITWKDDYGRNSDGTKRICLNDLNLGIIPPNADELNINNVNSDSDEDDNVHIPTNVPITDNTDGESKDKHHVC